jgi:hypothetical protein
LGIAWLLLAYLILATHRYAKAFWKSTYYLHAILGYAVLVITVYESIISLKKLNGVPDFFLPHHIIGLVIFAIVPIVTFSGSAIMFAGKPWWNVPQWKSHHEERISQLARFHRRFGYFSLFCGI